MEFKPGTYMWWSPVPEDVKGPTSFPIRVEAVDDTHVQFYAFNDLQPLVMPRDRISGVIEPSSREAALAYVREYNRSAAEQREAVEREILRLQLRKGDLEAKERGYERWATAMTKGTEPHPGGIARCKAGHHGPWCWH